MLYTFNFLFLLHYKIMSNSSLSSSPTVQRKNNNSFKYVYKHFEFIFVVFATLVTTYFDKIITTDLPKSQFCEKCAFYINFVNCSGNFCLLCWHYVQNYAGIIGSSLFSTLQILITHCVNIP